MQDYPDKNESFFYSEILRVIDALQLTDRLQVAATPADWKVSNKMTAYTYRTPHELTICLCSQVRK